MSLWVLIPVKPLIRAKSRLSSILSAEQRYEFAQGVLRQVLDVTTSIPEVVGTMVISRDTKVLAIAREMGAKTIQEGRNSSLNIALSKATVVLKSWGVQAVLVLPSDLPFVSVKDIRNLINMGRGYKSVVIATDSAENGTNALLMRPPAIFPYSYGETSYQEHIRLAREEGIEPRTYYSDNLALDVDVPDDLMLYNQIVEAGNFKWLSPYYPEVAGEFEWTPYHSL